MKPFTESREDHIYSVAYDASMIYQDRAYNAWKCMRFGEKRQADSGYCLDAQDEIPAGAMAGGFQQVTHREPQ